jgi:hypothetical protein
MNINIKQLINILSNDKIDVREKQNYFNLFFSKRNADFLRKSQQLEAFYYSETKIHNKEKALIKILSKKLEDQDFSIFWCHYYNEACFDRYNDLYFDDRGNTISESAYNDNYVYCSSCEEINHIDRINYIDNEHYCNSCRDEYFFYCDGCDDYIPNDNPCCCSEDEEEEQGNLYAYNYRIPLLNLGNSDLRYGIELELEVRNDYDRYDVVSDIEHAINKDETLIVCKRDGSLDQEYGFELVSTNADFNYHKNSFWNDFFKMDLNNKCKGYHGNNCGYHIHMTRNAFNEIQMSRLNCFYHNQKNRSFLIDIAGREENNYARFYNDINMNSDIFTDGDNGKYRAINFNNASTIEVRIFRSNLKQISFFRNLELVHSINQFILNSDSEIDFTDYFDYLLSNPSKDYVNLLLWLDQKNYFSHLEYIEDFKSRYNDFKNIVEDFKSNNQELIQQESEN